jgi:BASS family bile acid:Na+ symporter
MELFKALVPLIVQLSLILVVAAIGLQSRWSDLAFAFRQPVTLLKAVVAVNIAVPLAAAILIELFPMDPTIKYGIVLMAVSPVAPLVAGKMIKAGAEHSYSVGLYVAFTLLTIVVVPITLVILSAIFAGNAYITPSAVSGLMITSVFLPLCAGLIVRTVVPTFAERMAPIFSLVGNLALLAFIIFVVATSGPELLELLGDGTLLVIVLTLVAGIAAGHWLGGPTLPNRVALALAAATRHPGLAILIIKTNMPHPRAIAAVVLFLIVGVIVSGAYQALVRRRTNDATSSTVG